MRSLPFGGPLVLVKINGENLIKILDTGTNKNKGNGGYLQLANISLKNEKWYIQNNPIKPSATYHILMPKFVAQGKEVNLDLVKSSPFTEPKTYHDNIRNDIVDVFIAYLKTLPK